jgi:hypothetical protein
MLTHRLQWIENTAMLFQSARQTVTEETVEAVTLNIYCEGTGSESRSWWIQYRDPFMLLLSYCEQVPDRTSWSSGWHPWFLFRRSAVQISAGRRAILYYAFRDFPLLLLENAWIVPEIRSWRFFLNSSHFIIHLLPFNWKLYSFSYWKVLSKLQINKYYK